MSGEGKKVGVFGGIIAAIGAAFAHGADDCARVGVRAGAVAPEVAGVRAASNVGDDVARLSSRAGRFGRAGEELGAGERVALGGESRARFGVAAAAEDMHGSSTWEDVAEDLTQDLAENALQNLLDTSDADEPASADPSAPPVDVELLSVVPRTELEYALAFPSAGGVRLSLAPGAPSTTDHLWAFAMADRESLGAMLSRSGPNVARFVLGYISPKDPRALAFGDAKGTLDFAELEARGVSSGTETWLIACAKPDFGAKRPCGVVARELVEGVVKKGGYTSPRGVLHAIVEARDARKLTNLVVIGVGETTNGRRRLLSSRI